MRKVQKSLGHEADFQYDPPQYLPPPKSIADPKVVLSILRDSTSYTMPCGGVIRQLGSHKSNLGSNSPGVVKQQRILRHAVVGPKNSVKDFARLLGTTTSELIRIKGRKLRDISEVDIIRDVAVLSWTQFVSRLFYIPFKDTSNPRGAFNERELYAKLLNIFRYVYRDEDPATSAQLKKLALQAHKDVAEELGEVCDTIKCSSFAHVLLHRDRKSDGDNSLPNHGDELLQRLFDDGKTVEEVTSTAVLLAVNIAVSGSFALSQILDVLLSEPHYSAHWPRVQKIANDTAPWSNEALRVYVLEALRLSPPAAPFLRISDTLPSITDWRYAQAIKKGDTLHLDIASATRDPTRFPDPDQIKLDRPLNSYLPSVDGAYGPLVREIVVPGLVAQLRVLAKLEGLKKAPGIQGKWKTKSENGFVSFLSEAQDEWVPFPTSMKLHFISP